MAGESPASILIDQTTPANSATVTSGGQLIVQGKSAPTNLDIPAGTTAASLAVVEANLSLAGSSSDDTDYTITDTKVFTLTYLKVSSSGDSPCKVEVFYVDTGPTERIISRVYLSTGNVILFPHVNTSRSGNSLLGTNPPTTGLIRVRRTTLGSNATEIDFEIKGYET